MKTFNDIIPVLPNDAVHRITNMEYLRGVLDSQYAQTWRKYHNYGHLYEMLIEVNARIDEGSINPEIMIPELTMAILFHDLIYDLTSPSGQNELDSANAAIRYGLYCAPEIAWKQVHSDILATRHNGENVNTANAKILVDLDLWPFMWDNNDFRNSCENIIQEYEYKYSRKDILPKRIAFLTNFRQKIPFFYNIRAADQLAIRNIDFEIIHLTKELTTL